MQAFVQEHGPGGVTALAGKLHISKSAVSRILDGSGMSHETLERVKVLRRWVPSWERARAESAAHSAAPRVLRDMRAFADEIARAERAGEPYSGTALSLLTSYPTDLEDVSPEAARKIMRQLAAAAEAVDAILASAPRPKPTADPVSGVRSGKAASVAPAPTTRRR